jgi:hypothetical protein
MNLASPPCPPVFVPLCWGIFKTQCDRHWGISPAPRVFPGGFPLRLPQCDRSIICDDQDEKVFQTV